MSTFAALAQHGVWPAHFESGRALFFVPCRPPVSLPDKADARMNLPTFHAVGTRVDGTRSMLCSVCSWETANSIVSLSIDRGEYTSFEIVKADKPPPPILPEISPPGTGP